MKCESYERWWVDPDINDGRCVDAHLTDVWLTSLNRLTMFTLTSICEGHLGANGLSKQDHPSLRFRLRSQFVPHLRVAWSRDAHEISCFLRSSIEKTTTSVRFGWSEFDRDVFFLDLDCSRKRESPQMESWVADWFDDALVRLQNVDGLMNQYEPIKAVL